ncbi:MAG: histidine kinase [Arcobacter sp.]|nr:histidine kinase [Arcobacter sp.]|tara:strand:+ start:6578 stop:8464 length:1887 start_codon:yes stop_codon:yes gene_type:complete
MNYENEKQILNIIKFTPPLFIISISIIITIFLYTEKQLSLKKEKDQIKTQFIKNNKELIKKDVDKLYDFIKITQKETEKKLKEKLKERVKEAHRTANAIYSINKDIKSEEEIKKLIKEALVHIRFNQNRGYYFIYSLDNYECILLPIARKFEGKSFYNFKDGKGEFLTRKIVAQIKKEKEGYLSWWYHKPDDKVNQYKKIGFNMHFEPYNWFIGTGEYFVDYEKIVKNEVLEYVKKLSSSLDSYYFILDYEGNIQASNKKDNKELILKESNKKELISIAKFGEGYLSYDNSENSGERNSIKTSYSKGLDEWNWVISRVFHEKEIEQLFKLKKEDLNRKFDTNVIFIFNLTAILTLILLAISLYISKLLKFKFEKYKNDIKEKILENDRQQHMIAQQSKMAAMGEMLGNIAHQWRQPLSMITTAASGMKMQKEFGDLDDETFNYSVDNITNSAQYLSKTIDDFRNFFKTDKVSSYIKIASVLEKTLKLTKEQFKSNEINLVENIENYEIYGVENELIQALINILNNSRDVLLTKKYERRIQIDTYIKGDKGILKITDNGGGIKEDIIDKVFEPYFTTKHKAQGTGIGLYMTEEIIKKHLAASITIKNTTLIIEKSEYKGLETKIAFNLA